MSKFSGKAYIVTPELVAHMFDTLIAASEDTSTKLTSALIESAVLRLLQLSVENGNAADVSSVTSQDEQGVYHVGDTSPVSSGPTNALGTNKNKKEMN